MDEVMDVELLTECEWCGGPMPTTGRFRRTCSSTCYYAKYEAEHPRRDRWTPEYNAKRYQDDLERLGKDVIMASRRRQSLKQQFGLTLDDYNALLETQNGVCALCSKTPEENGRALAVDHDHSCCPGKITCGKCIRGLLCTTCNQRLGTIESMSWMKLANNYLDSYRGEIIG
jgi:ribosomal protein L24E